MPAPGQSGVHWSPAEVRTEIASSGGSTAQRGAHVIADLQRIESAHRLVCSSQAQWEGSGGFACCYLLCMGLQRRWQRQGAGGRKPPPHEARPALRASPAPLNAGDSMQTLLMVIPSMLRVCSVEQASCTVSWMVTTRMPTPNRMQDCAGGEGATGEAREAPAGVGQPPQLPSETSGSGAGGAPSCFAA